MLILWFVLVGVVLVLMAFSSHLVQRLPLSPAIIYLGVGALAGAWGLGLLPLDLWQHHQVIEVITEVVVLITLFAVGLRLQLPMVWRAWRIPVRLATLGMVLTVAMIAALGHAWLGLPLGAAVLLGGILAPTDPVLASDVQIREPGDRDAVRMSITAEGGMNDGTAFPAIMLGLGLLQHHAIGAGGWRWFAVDLVWAIAAGLAVGWFCGRWVGQGMAWLRRQGHPLESEEFLVFGLIALAYGVALALHAYGFLAVFAAGAGLSAIEKQRDQRADPIKDASQCSRLDSFSGQCERLSEVAVVLLIGALLAWVEWRWELFVFAAVVLLVIRPLAVYAVVRGPQTSGAQRRLIAWFGIRGVGSLYYLSFAVGYGMDPAWGTPLAGAVLATIASSIVLHGMSATPLMDGYHRRR
ncbi:MAG: cation:proton antiporter [Roseateles sp.]|uniref:cation:proton antiporter n=1 Tax=Roseateles sp. TaxID=1971397 RepID=UPI004035F014